MHVQQHFLFCIDNTSNTICKYVCVQRFAHRIISKSIASGQYMHVHQFRKKILESSIALLNVGTIGLTRTKSFLYIWYWGLEALVKQDGSQGYQY